ncbi:phosphate signaling complex protein PhoU [Gleimia europaea]|uniref:Phosphate-specific transport system accessory protein PhoU n=1 Tax=Gleimia europaea ACS-120-V-Col10b TaxID=883069 RepID=A0A9W5VX10_9ACTO|nr:phosphate signaling complex protein PhoU [Gleimia europaea]EPD31503.1 phosphate transport system regulatory protein PhoU [Gleimia europaea ACS-120-V-Col10b]
MREMYTQELTQLGNQLSRMAAQVSRAVSRASRSLDENDSALAEQTIDADERIDDLAYIIDEMCTQLLALQAPVARDLRLIVTGLRMTKTLERMGDLARNIAIIARQQAHTDALPPEIVGIVKKMGVQARIAGENTAKLMEDPNTDLANQMQTDDDVMDDLHVQLHRMLLDPDLVLTPTQIINLTLVGRYYERFGDHATNVGRNVMYLIEGERFLAE